jgi:hypothetical protein
MVTLMEGLVLTINPRRAVARRVADEIYRYYGSAPANQT